MMYRLFVVMMVLALMLVGIGGESEARKHKKQQDDITRVTIGEDCLADEVCAELYGTNGSAKWKNTSTIYVADHSSPLWGNYVQTKVQEWHAQMWWATQGRIAIVYSPQSRVYDCSGVPAYANTITVCTMSTFPAYPAGVTDVWFNSNNAITKALTKLVGVTPSQGAWGHGMGCHELGHALGLNHPYDWNLDTCMSVYRDTPSPGDGSTLREKYG